MGIKDRVKRLERIPDPNNPPWSGNRIFIKEVGGEGRDPDGWLPGEKEEAEEATTRGAFVTIIEVSERKSAEAVNNGN